MQHSPYRTLALLLVVNAVIMFLLTYVTVDQLAHFQVNLNRVYRALLMVAGMTAPMMLLMAHMYPSRKASYAIAGAAVLAFFGLFAMVRSQALIGDEQFLRSMIPHHSGAILMCERAAITDAEIIALCRQIVDSQEREIAEMEALLRRRR